MMPLPFAHEFVPGWRPLRTVVWRRLDEPAMEVGTLAETADGFVLGGQVISAAARVPSSVWYHVLCDRDWHTVEVQVELTHGAAVTQLLLRRESDGRWFRDDRELSALRGLYDVDLGFTPATNTLPIRRLAPAVGESRDVTAAWVRFPDLAVEPLPQEYTRMGERSYRYQSRGGSFRALIDVDDVGLVTAYEALFERLAAT